MTKIAAILYLSLILIQSINIGFEDFSKLKMLIKHAEYHQENYGDSFLDFLAEHYGNLNIQHGNEHKEHEGLPFKHKHQTCVHVNTAFTLPPLNFTFNYHPFIETPFNFFYKESTSLFEKPSVFQPPRLT